MAGPARLSLDQVNAATAETFVAQLGPIFEHAPWVAQACIVARPFATVAALHQALLEAVRQAPRERQLAFLRGHPELASKVARAGAITAESQAEQGSLGLDRLSDEEFAEFERLNAAYREKFGFPFIICVRRHTRDSILAQFAARLAHDTDTEFAAALTEVGFITRLRLVDKVEGPGAPQTAGRLSTHVLDTYHGRPAAGVTLTLYEVGASARGLLKQAITNADGRTDTPLIAGEPLRVGTYELQFDVDAYFARTAAPTAAPPFLGLVPIRFAIAEPEGHYHVPLVVTPWSYATYRGS